MSYQVLARKWRPKSFEQLVGQKQTATALSNALESQRLHHAYLFTGTRGVGKTTIARILSKSLNCENGITATPCGECASCTEIDQGNFVDLMEIDAASKTKVEDTRELLDNVQYRPTRGRYKVYLIDEVHMLSGHSFNALLKTLEEPPPHVIFLLATTDPQKLPVTVLSRCLQFHLRRMEEQQIVDHLSKILTAESIQFEQSALKPIAKGADGSMRDALSLLDQAIAYSGESISQQAVLEMLGTIDQNFCIRLLGCVQSNDASAVMGLIKEMAQFSPDFIEVMSDWLNLLHRLAVIQATEDNSDPELSELATQISAADLQLYYQLSLQAKKDLAYAPHPRQGFEMALLRVLAFRPKSTLDPNTQGQSLAKKKLINSQVEVAKSESNDSTSASNNSLSAQDNRPIEAIRPINHMNTSGNTQAETAESFAPHPEIQVLREQPVSDGLSVAPDSKANLSLVADNSQTARETKNVIQNEEQVKATDEAKISNQVSAEDQVVPKIDSEKTILRDVNDSPTEVSTQKVDNDDKQLESSTNKKERLAYHERPLYPDESKVNLESITRDNWHVVIDQMRFSGNGQQVLINSLAEYTDGKLQISYLKMVEHFLTENLSHSLIKKIRKYFKQPQLQIVFESIEQIEYSPKDRQVAMYKQALEDAYQNIIENSCVAKLQQSIGASVDKSTIVLK